MRQRKCGYPRSESNMKLKHLLLTLLLCTRKYLLILNSSSSAGLGRSEGYERFLTPFI